MNITERSAKADIIDASIEVIDTQAEQIQELQQRQTVLIVALSSVFCFWFLF